MMSFSPEDPFKANFVGQSLLLKQGSPADASKIAQIGQYKPEYN